MEENKTAHLDLGYESLDDDSSSVDTHDAVLEMLGLKNEVIMGMVEVENSIEGLVIKNSIEGLVISHEMKNLPHTIAYATIQFPPQCSRHAYQSKDCFGLILDNIMDEEKCKSFIELAEASGFRYIREATHNAPDGSSYTVQIQSPNPHKLSAIDTFHCVNNSDKRNNMNPLDQDHNKELTFVNGLHPFISSKDTTCNLVATNLVDLLYQSIYTHITSNEVFHKFIDRKKCGLPMGLNPRIRVLKYDAEDNDSFQPHFDATTLVPKESKKSLVTVLLYLNSGLGVDFQGGNTVFTNYSADMFVAGNKSHMKAFRNHSHDYTSMKSYTEVTPILGRVVLFEHDMFHSGEPLQWGTKYILRTDLMFRDDNNEEQNISEKKGIMVKEKSLENSFDEKTLTKLQPNLISDVCSQMNMSPRYCGILNDLGLYDDCTCNTFLSPGATALTTILVDHGIDRETVHRLIQEVAQNKQ